MFNETTTTEIYTLSLHDALPIYLSYGEDGIASINSRDNAFDTESRGYEDFLSPVGALFQPDGSVIMTAVRMREFFRCHERSEEHTSELQSLRHLVCRLLLEKKNK